MDVQHADLIADLSRRGFLARAGALGLGAVVAGAVPVARDLVRPAGAQAATPDLLDATLQAFADTIIPGRKVAKTESGRDVHPQAIAGVDPLPGAVETDALALYHHPLTGFDSLAPDLHADLAVRSLAAGGTFLSLSFDKRVGVLKSGLDFSNPTRVIYEAGAAVPFTAFCAAALVRNATSAKAAGYRVMGLPGVAPNGYQTTHSYKRKLARERTKRGYLG